MRTADRRPADAASRSSASRRASPVSRCSCGRGGVRASAGSCSCSARPRSGRPARSSPRSCRCPDDAVRRDGDRDARGRRRAPPARPRLPGRRVARPGRRGRGARCVGLVYLVLIGSLVGYTAYVWLLGNLPISTVATYAYVNPVVAILLGVVFLDEGVTWRIVVRRGGRARLGRARDPERGAVARAVRRVKLARGTERLQPSQGGRRSRRAARAPAAAACRSRPASPPRRRPSRRRSAARRRP